MSFRLGHVIPSQCSHWRGNPFPLRLYKPRGTESATKDADCHTSDPDVVCLPLASIRILICCAELHGSLVRNDTILMTLP